MGPRQLTRPLGNKRRTQHQWHHRAVDGERSAEQQHRPPVRQQPPAHAADELAEEEVDAELDARHAGPVQHGERAQQSAHEHHLVAHHGVGPEAVRVAAAAAVVARKRRCHAVEEVGVAQLQRRAGSEAGEGGQQEAVVSAEAQVAIAVLVAAAPGKVDAAGEAADDGEERKDKEANGRSLLMFFLEGGY